MERSVDSLGRVNVANATNEAQTSKMAQFRWQSSHFGSDQMNRKLVLPSQQLLHDRRQRSNRRRRSSMDEDALRSLKPSESSPHSRRPRESKVQPTGLDLEQALERDRELVEALMSVESVPCESCSDGKEVMWRFQRFMRDRILRNSQNSNISELLGNGTELEYTLFPNYDEIQSAWRKQAAERKLLAEKEPRKAKRYFCSCKGSKDRHSDDTLAPPARIQMEEEEEWKAKFECSDLYDTELYGILKREATSSTERTSSNHSTLPQGRGIFGDVYTEVPAQMGWDSGDLEHYDDQKAQNYPYLL